MIQPRVSMIRVRSARDTSEHILGTSARDTSEHILDTSARDTSVSRIQVPQIQILSVT